MELSVKARKVDGGVVIIDMTGKLSSGEPIMLLRSTVHHFVEEGCRKFVINLGAVSYIDSSGLGELIITYISLRKREGNVNLLNLTRRAKDILQMTKLLTVFDSFDDEAKAVQALNLPDSATAGGVS